ncbi:hypothetical protein GCM10018773_14910 [Streptomyces candidus]|nr:hypothetical protein GCM10018773_14910 [Streptomyces candidus]
MRARARGTGAGQGGAYGGGMHVRWGPPPCPPVPPPGGGPAAQGSYRGEGGAGRGRSLSERGGQEEWHSAKFLGVRVVREALFASRTGPPPAGMKVAASPSPLDPVQRADPRTSHGSAPSVLREERTAGRTATRQEHESDGTFLPGPRGSFRTGPAGNNLAIGDSPP